MLQPSKLLSVPHDIAYALFVREGIIFGGVHGRGFVVQMEAVVSTVIVSALHRIHRCTADWVLGDERVTTLSIACVVIEMEVSREESH